MPHNAFDAAILLQICHAIKYRSKWLVDVVHHLEAESMSHSLEHVLFSSCGKLDWPVSAEVKKVN